MNPTTGFTSEEMGVFRSILGGLAFSIPGAAKLARHKRPMSTVRDYLDIQPKDDKITKAAKEYLKDLARMNTDELWGKWDGKDMALVLDEGI